LIRGLILAKATVKAAATVPEEAKKIKGVTDAYPVFGRFDLVVFLEAKDFEELKSTALRVNAIVGIRSTETLVEAT
jgi:uncharacterized protein with GYD domain